MCDAIYIWGKKAVVEICRTAAAVPGSHNQRHGERVTHQRRQESMSVTEFSSGKQEGQIVHGRAHTSRLQLGEA